jgi:hypothetical protein
LYPKLPPLPSSALAHLRYFAVLGVTAFTCCHLILLLAADIVTTQTSSPGEARELSRVETIMHARETTYLQSPTQPAVLPLHVDEPKLLASNLAVDIDRAEATDAPVQDYDRAHASTVQVASIRAPSHPTQAKTGLTRKSRLAAKSAPLDIAALPDPDLKNSRSPVPDTQAVTVTSLKTAVQAEAPAKAEPVRKKLARRSPNAGELIMMQLLNQI